MAVADAIRVELAPFSIDEVTAQLGSVTSNIRATGTNNAILPADSFFTSLAEHIRSRAEAS